MIRCKKCDNLNDLDRILCISCGTKLDFNDPSLIETASAGESSEEKLLKKTRVKVKLDDGSFTKKILYIFLLFIFFIFGFLMFSTSNIPPKDLNINAVKSLDKKLKAISGSNAPKYLIFSDKEINIYIERVISSYRIAINESYPDFFEFDRISLSITEKGTTLFISFILFNRPLIVRLYGDIVKENNSLTFNISRAYIGQLLVTKRIQTLITNSIHDILNKADLFKLPEKVESLKIDKRKLVLFMFKDATVIEKQAHLSTNAKIPDDVLIIQAGDTFFSQENYQLALKYYRLAKFKFPNSPLRSYSTKQIKICRGKL